MSNGTVFVNIGLNFETMKTLTTDGQRKVSDLANRYHVQPATVESLLHAIIQGNGTMAQFNVPELGGQGQWMKGGMTMVGDMFNTTIKSTVEKLSGELAELVATHVLFDDTEENAVRGLSAHAENATSPDSSDPTQFNHSGRTQYDSNQQSASSWPAIFGNPTASGSQNNVSYAYFAPVRRLVIEDGGKRTIYDTKHHQITGISQQQGSENSYRFTSQDGPVDLSSLQRVSDPDAPRQSTPEMPYDVTSTGDFRVEDKSPEDIVMATIEKLNILFERGQISEEEFRQKKKELLERL